MCVQLSLILFAGNLDYLSAAVQARPTLSQVPPLHLIYRTIHHAHGVRLRVLLIILVWKPVLFWPIICLDGDIKEFRCVKVKIEESEKAGSHQELNPGHLRLVVG